MMGIFSARLIIFIDEKVK